MWLPFFLSLRVFSVIIGLEVFDMKYLDVSLYSQTDTMLNQLEKGAFLTTMKNKMVNTMTIAWGGIHIIWGKPVYAIYVRYSRETYNYLKQ